MKNQFITIEINSNHITRDRKLRGAIDRLKKAVRWIELKALGYYLQTKNEILDRILLLKRKLLQRHILKEAVRFLEIYSSLNYYEI